MHLNLYIATRDFAAARGAYEEARDKAGVSEQVHTAVDIYWTICSEVFVKMHNDGAVVSASWRGTE